MQSEILAEALRLHQSGSLIEAERLYRKILAIHPNHAESLHLLGVIAYQQGQLELAVDRIGKALAVKPDFPEAYRNLGNVLRKQGRMEEAVAVCRKAIVLRPHQPEGHATLGNILMALGKPEEASASYLAALHQRPNFPEVLSNLGVAYRSQGRVGDAIGCYRKALALRPDYSDAYGNLGRALMDQGRLSEAETCCLRAVELNPQFVEAHMNLGYVLECQGRLMDANACYRKVIELKPQYAEAYSNLGNVLKEQGRQDDAIACLRKAIELKPEFPEGHNNLANVLREQGRLHEAVACYREAVRLRTDYLTAHSNIILTLHHIDPMADGELLGALRSYAALMPRPSDRPAFRNVPAPDRRLRIGYVSGDLHAHPVGYFLGKVLKAHNPSKVEIFCYCNSNLADEVTADLRAAAHQWRIIAGKSDDEVNALVRRDGIDILIDLSGHTGRNRLAVFAARAAPVQVTWLGYFGTTGIDAMDYILADRFVVPPGEEAQFTESVYRLPDSYLCFTPPSFDVPIVARPSSGEMVLGCFNSLAKLSEGTVRLWARILSEIPGCRLLLKTRGLDGSDIRRTALERFARHGIAADRLILEGPSPRVELLAAYNRVDVALDPFPYGGGTTTAEALWMGVPVVTLRGDGWVGRVSESILATIGLPDLVAADADGYVTIVRGLADDRNLRASLHSSLRRKMEGSPFCDGSRFASSLEVAYRAMWRNWCSGQAGDASRV